MKWTNAVKNKSRGGDKQEQCHDVTSRYLLSLKATVQTSLPGSSTPACPPGPGTGPAIQVCIPDKVYAVLEHTGRMDRDKGPDSYLSPQLQIVPGDCYTVL
jgi:hypothetical protein